MYEIKILATYLVLKNDLFPKIEFRHSRITSNIPGGLVDLMAMLNDEARDTLMRRTLINNRTGTTMKQRLAIMFPTVASVNHAGNYLNTCYFGSKTIVETELNKLLDK